MNEKSRSDSYAAAGVDITAGYKAVEMMKTHIARTVLQGGSEDIGGFGGLFELDITDMPHPVLVSGTDGVGTKLKLAFLMDKHDTVGIDCVAMCVNDIICCGAKPLFFLDYIACGKNFPEKIASIVSGIAEGCVQAGCQLVGGETAEMPGFYSMDEFDIAGFAVGAVSKDKLINGAEIKPGDVLIGLPSSGLHSNGFSLIRKIFNPSAERLSGFVNALGCTVGEELLRPTRIYVKTVLDLMGKFHVKGISHITGGGFFENIPRMGGPELCYVIEKGSWNVLPIFGLTEKMGHVEEIDMYNTFNMGIGMVLAVDSAEADRMIQYLSEKGEIAYMIGHVADRLPEGGLKKGNLSIC